jgi:Alcohol dehydrogenase GroES-like domain
MTATMLAVVLRAAGGPEQLACEQVAVPSPGAGEALVRVYAAAITRDELEWPVDRLPAIPSYEVSGVVEAVGPGVDGLAAGDEVYGMTPFDRDGVAAEYAAIPAELLAPKPRTLSHLEAAAVPLAALSAWQGLFDHGALSRDERVLIHGATGGVGQFATPLARRRGARVTATTSTRGVQRARELGADVVIAHTTGRWDAGLEPVHLVFDTAGGERLAAPPPYCATAAGSSRSPKSRRRRPASSACTSSSSRTPGSSCRSPSCSTAACRRRPSTPCSSSRTPRAPSRAACSPTSAARSCSTPVPLADRRVQVRQARSAGLPTTGARNRRTRRFSRHQGAPRR